MSSGSVITCVLSGALLEREVDEGSGVDDDSELVLDGEPEEAEA